MTGARQLSFEVYYLQHGRWSIHARFGAEHREEAIEEAKRLDHSGHFDAACVVRDSFDSAAGQSDETVIYHSPSLKSKPPVTRITAGLMEGQRTDWRAQAPPPGSAAANAMEEAKKKEAEFLEKQMAEIAEREADKSPVREPDFIQPLPQPAAGDRAPVEMALKIAVITLVSMIPAAALAYLAFFAMRAAANMGYAVNTAVGQSLLILTFILGFAAVFVPLLRKHVDLGVFGSGSQPAAWSGPESSGVAAVGAAPAPPDPSPMEELEEPFEDGFAAENDLELDAAALTAPEAGIGGSGAVRSDDLGDIAQDYILRAEQVAREIEVTPVHGDKPPDLGSVDKGLDRVVGEVRSLFGEGLDSYTRFGVTLFLAGVGEVLGRRGHVAKDVVQAGLIRRVQALGETERLARGFVRNIDEYLLDDRYFEMYRRGRSCACRRIVDDEMQSGLVEALREWRAPTEWDDAIGRGTAEGDQRAAEGNGMGVAVLCTEIVGARTLQQKKGDEGMADVIRAHNEIVREAMRRFGGREIRHTGDGVMAAFPTPSRAVDAGLSMQASVARFSEAMPGRAFALRCGVSYGRPVGEGAEPSGAPVGMAARILSRSGAGEVAVSLAIRDLCADEDFEFEEFGVLEIQGGTATQPVFRAAHAQLLQTRPDFTRRSGQSAAGPV